MRKIIFCIVYFVFAFMTVAECKAAEVKELEEVVVTATRIEEPLSITGSSVTVITEDDIRNQGALTVGEVLRNVPGIYVLQQGSQGSLTTAFMRGAASNQTLVLIDGVRVNSPANGIFDLSTLPAENIERIEIVRGPQSALYGSEAMGGVINVITKKGFGKPTFSGFFEAGNLRTTREGAAIEGSKEGSSWSFNLTRLDTDGFLDHDEFGSTNFSGLYRSDLRDDISLTFSGRFYDASKKLPPVAGRFFDPTQEQDTRSALLALKVDHKMLDWWRNSLTTSIVDDRIRFNDPLWSYRSNTDTLRKRAELLSSVDLSKDIKGIVGIELEEQTGEFNASDPFSGVTAYDKVVTNKAYFVETRMGWNDTISLTGGLRWDVHSTFGTTVSPRFSGSYLVKETGTKFKASIGEGFRSPTLNELFFPGFGNPGLNPEKSVSYELGMEQHFLKGKGRFGITFFKTTFTDLIAFVPTSDPDYPFGIKPVNIAKALSEGFEVEGSIVAGYGITISGGYTHLRTVDRQTDEELLRRPNDSGFVQIQWDATKNIVMNLNATFVGERRDLDPQSFLPKENPGFQKLDFALRWNLLRDAYRIKRLYAVLKIENLLNKNYEEALGFPAPPRTFLAGMMAGF